MVVNREAVTEALREHLGVCDDLLLLAQKEAEALRQPGPFPVVQFQIARKDLLARLEASSHLVASQRNRWGQPNASSSDSPPELADLARTTLDKIMRVLVIDRENEQTLLRRGLLPPRSLPRAEQSRPNFVALTYQRHAQG
jgi:hypothetical protein